MKRKSENIKAPAVGCMIGQAYQKLLSELSVALKAAGLDITNNEYLILRALYSSDSLQQCQLSDMTGKDKALICRCVAALEHKGLVRTEPVSHKCLIVHLTQRAKDIEPDVIGVANLRHQTLVSICTKEELDSFISVLNKILIN